MRQMWKLYHHARCSLSVATANVTCRPFVSKGIVVANSSAPRADHIAVHLPITIQRSSYTMKYLHPQTPPSNPYVYAAKQTYYKLNIFETVGQLMIMQGECVITSTNSIVCQITDELIDFVSKHNAMCQL